MYINRKKMIWLTLLFAAIFIAALITYNQQKKKEAEYWNEKVPVVTAKQEIEPGTIIKTDMLYVNPTPRKFIYNPKDSSEMPGSFAGRVALRKIYKDEIMLFSIAAEQSEKLGLTYIVPRGKRAVSVGVDAVGMQAGLIRPGDYVDVYVTFNNERTVTLLQNVQVLAVEQNMQKEIKPDVANKAEWEKKADAKSWVIFTLALVPTDAEKLILASLNGVIRLALRGKEDPETSKTSGISKGSLINNSAAKAIDTKVKTEEVIIIKGTKTETTKKVN